MRPNRMRELAVVTLAWVAASAASGLAAQELAVPGPVFTQADRVSRLEAALPDIERLFQQWVERQRMPGAVFAVIIDDRVAGVYTAGRRDLAAGDPVTPETVFRIASMTKSFTALAILKLRDEGRLALDDPVARYTPELAGLRYPTVDSPPLTIRHLLTHSEGFPEDNPWGDRQLARPADTVRAWLRAGIPFSNPPGIAYEYSNYGFALLGLVVERVAGEPYDVFLDRELLRPLGLRATTLHGERVPAARRAAGYRAAGEGWAPEQALGHGAFGAMGGLWTDVHDLAQYVAWQLQAWPPRDEAERGPVRRSSLREMQQPWRSAGAAATRATLDAPATLNVGGYGYGLRITRTCDFTHVGHGGGLPGYGSLMRWLPEHGVGLVAMANLTYASFGGLFDEALGVLARTGALQPRTAQAGPELRAASADVTRLIGQWHDSLAHRIAADNLFLDTPAAEWQRRLADVRARHGACQARPGLNAENALRGSWRLDCERGWLVASVTLAPTHPATVQHLAVRSVLPPGPALAGALEAALRIVNDWDGAAATALASPGLDLDRLERAARLAALQRGRCTLGEVQAGDGARNAEVLLQCERGPLLLRAAVEPEGRRFTRLELAPHPGGSCGL